MQLEVCLKESGKIEKYSISSAEIGEDGFLYVIDVFGEKFCYCLKEDIIYFKIY